MAAACTSDAAATSQAQAFSGGAEDADGGATLADLCPNDKAKVGNLLRELARAQRDGQSASAERQEYRDKLLKLRSQNSEIIQVICATVRAPPRLVRTRPACPVADHRRMS